MHRELVETRRWIAEPQFLRGLNFCTLLPGPEAQQLATYIGWRLHGTLGGVVAGSFFVIPSIFVLLILSWLAAAYGDVPAVSGMLYGVQPVVVAILLDALFRIGRRTLRHPVLLGFALGAFAALQILRVPFPVVVLGAGLLGAALQRGWPSVFRPRSAEGGPGPDGRDVSPRPPLARALKIAGLFAALWAMPFGALWLWRGADDVLVQEALFFTQAAFVTFGGAYAVLSYIADAAVHSYGWLDAEQMVQGLGLAESTPGPLIMVTQYVGFLGAWRSHGEFPQLLYGTLGALITTYATFLPSFFLIFLGAPYIEPLARSRRLQAALVGVTASVVGVIASLGVLFGTSVLFRGATLDLYAVVVTILTFAVLRTAHTPVQYLVLAGAIAGILWRSIAPAL